MDRITVRTESGAFTIDGDVEITPATASEITWRDGSQRTWASTERFMVRGPTCSVKLDAADGVLGTVEIEHDGTTRTLHKAEIMVRSYPFAYIVVQGWPPDSELNR